MRAKITFQIEIDFAEPARALNQLLRLSPRSFDSQYVSDWYVGVEPEARLRRSEDGFGNYVYSCSHEGPLDRIVLTAEGVVELTDAAGVVRGQAERLPLDVFLRDTEATQAGEALRAFAKASTAGETESIAKLHSLMAAVHEAVAFEPGPGAPRDAEKVFAKKSGTAREMAQIFIAAARTENIPARFVSGLYLADVGLGAHHAWAEAYVEGLGWIGFDPAFDFCPRADHLRIAQGLDYSGAAPRRSASVSYAPETEHTILSVAAKQAGRQSQQ